MIHVRIEKYYSDNSVYHKNGIWLSVINLATPICIDVTITLA